MNRTKQVVDELQSTYGTAKQYYITPQVVEEPGVPKTDYKHTVRAAVGGLVAGVSMTVLLGRVGAAVAGDPRPPLLAPALGRPQGAAQGQGAAEIAIVTTTSDDEPFDDGPDEAAEPVAAEPVHVSG